MGILSKVKHTITIDPELLKELKVFAVKEDLKYSQAIEDAIKEYLEKKKKQK